MSAGQQAPLTISSTKRLHRSIQILPGRKRMIQKLRRISLIRELISPISSRNGSSGITSTRRLSSQRRSSKPCRMKHPRLGYPDLIRRSLRSSLSLPLLQDATLAKIAPVKPSRLIRTSCHRPIQSAKATGQPPRRRIEEHLVHGSPCLIKALSQILARQV